jgi:hypothetical protein
MIRRLKKEDFTKFLKDRIKWLTPSINRAIFDFLVAITVG